MTRTGIKIKENVKAVHESKGPFQTGDVLTAGRGIIVTTKIKVE